MSNNSCAELTETLKSIQPKLEELDLFIADRRPNEGLKLKNEILESVEITLEKVDKFKIHIRKRIAEKHDLANIRIASSNCYIGEYRQTAEKSEVFKCEMLFGKDGKPKGSPHDLIIDSGEGTYLACDTSLTDFKYSLIDQSGEIIKELPEIASLVESKDFSTDKPLQIQMLNGATASLRPDGRIIFKNIISQALQNFSEGLSIVKDTFNDNIRIYDTDENMIKTLGNIQSVSIFSHGHAIALRKNQNDNLDVLLIDRNGGTTPLGVEIDENVENTIVGVSGGIYHAGDLSTTYYFTETGLFYTEQETDNNKHILIDSQTSDYLFAQQNEQGMEQLIDKNGDALCPDLFKVIVDYKNGFVICIDENDCYHFVDKNGHLLEVREKLLHVHPFINEYAVVQDAKGWFLIDTDGNDTFHGKRFENIPGDVVDGVIGIDENGKEIYLDCHGNKVWGE